MKRKTAIKKLMGMGYSRNDAETKLFWARAFDWSNESVVMMFKVKYHFDSLAGHFVKTMKNAFGFDLAAAESFTNFHNAIYDDHDISGLLEDY